MPRIDRSGDILRLLLRLQADGEPRVCDERTLGVLAKMLAVYLDFSVSTVGRPAGVDWIVPFAFGFEFTESGGRVPGPVNKLLAEIVARWFQEFSGVPIWTQWEVKEALRDTSFSAFDRVHQAAVPLRQLDGVAGELTSYDVLFQLKQLVEQRSKRLLHENPPTIAIVAQRLHLSKCVRVAEGMGFRVWTDQEQMPNEYVSDLRSGQAWTMSEVAFAMHEVLSGLSHEAKQIYGAELAQTRRGT